MEKIKLEYILAVYKGEESGNLTAWVLNKEDIGSLAPEEVTEEEMKKLKIRRLL